MTRQSWLASVFAIGVLGGCATPQPYDLSAFNREPPRSILIVPVVNRSLDVDASNYVLSTLTVPLAELGYYVFPVNTVKVLLEHEGLYEAEQIRRMEPAQLAALFGADAVLYVTINRWDAQYVIFSTTVTVDFDYELDGKSGALLWKANKRMQYTPQQSQQGSALAIIVSAVITAAAARAAPNYLPLTQQANSAVFTQDPTKLPPGPYARRK